MAPNADTELATMTVLTDPDDPRRQAFTGVSDPYEAPGNPECRIDTSQLQVAEAVDQLLQVLEDSGDRGTRGLTRHTSS